MMEISKGLRREIILVQNKLKNAIRDHQICMGKLKDNSNNADILGQIEEIRLNIISLGRCQKQVVQRLRKEVESFKAENANGAKVSIASLLGLNNNYNNNNNNNNNNKNNNNKHVVTTDNEDREEVVQVKVQANGILDSRRLSKENYEEVVRNGIITASGENICAKERSKSVETLSAEEDVIEVSDDDNSDEKNDEVEGVEEMDEALMSEYSRLNSRQVMFLGTLGLITASRFSELQNKRAERKRRSTANPQFVYSNWDIPTKRKRHSYLQSIGNAPQTRQTTARLNGPSPPPSKIASSKSTPSPNKSSSKSLMLMQKATVVRPNILRNVSECQESMNKGRLENGISEKPLTNAKPTQAKTMHIPGLPSCLTIERIESDTAVCIYCRNPGTLTFCDNCSISYHASCRSSSPPPMRLCSKCVQHRTEEECSPPTTVIKKDEELAPTSFTSGVIGEAGKDPEVNKTSGGFYQIDATPSSRFIATGNYNISQLPTSTYLIPIAPSNITNPTGNNTTAQQPNIANDINIANTVDTENVSDTRINNVTYSPFIINQHDNQQAHNTYPLPLINSETTEKQQQSFLVIKKLSDPCVGGIVNYNHHPSHQYHSSYNQQQNSTISYTLPISESREGQHDFVRTSPLLYDQLAGSRPESTIRNNKKSTTRTIPGLKPIASTEKHSVNGNHDSSDIYILESPAITTDDRKQWCKSDVIGVQSIDLTENQSCRTESSSNELGSGASVNQCANQAKSSNLRNALLSSNNKSNTVSNCINESNRDSFKNLPSGSIADRLYRRLSQDQSCMRGTRESSTKLTEYVKLEEAHLSAPPTTNLIEYQSIEKNEGNSPLIRPKSCPTAEIMTYDKRVFPRILMRNGRRSLDSLQTSHIANVVTNDASTWKRFHHVNCDDILSGKSEKVDPNILEDTLTATEGECDDDDDDDDDEATDSPDDIDDDKIASNIDMQVLEDFESAMMEVNRNDTAN